jgi:hypothetical protein
MAIPTTNTPYFDNFPRFRYDVNYGGYPVNESVTDIFYRIGMIKEVLKNISSYYVYEIKEGDTPDTLANRVYGDSGVGWIILYANDMYDPQFDWPLNYDAFNAYLKNKYGSIEYSKSNIHHFEKIIKRTIDGVTNETRYNVDEQRLTSTIPSVPYSYYYSYGQTSRSLADSTFNTADNVDLFADQDVDYSYTVGALPVQVEYETLEIGNTTIQQEISKKAITYYDHELELNDNKRTIKLIKKDYYEGLITEFFRKTFEAKNYDVDAALYISNYIRRLTL